jgi:hypothetical protein
MSCEFLKATAENIIKKLDLEGLPFKNNIEILDVLPADEFGQDNDEVVIQYIDPVYKGNLNEMRYYISLTMDELTISLDTCVDQMELKSIIDPEWDKPNLLTQEIFLTLIDKK